MIEARVRNTTTLFGMDKAYYRNNGVCIVPDSVRCFSDGTFAMYSSPRCGGTAQNLTLTSSVTVFPDSSTLRNVQGSMITVTTGSTQYSWTVLIPTQTYVPSFRYWNDWMLIILYVSGILMALGSSAYHFRNFWAKKTLYLGMIFMSQVFWLSFLVVRLASSWGNFSNAFDGSIYFFQMLGSLTAILNALHFVLNMWKVDNLWYYIVYGVTLVIHFAMNWNNYTRFNLIDMTAVFTRDLVSVVTKVNLAWMFFMFIFDCLPPIYVIVKLLHSFDASWQEKAMAVWRTDKWFMIVLIGQFLTLFFYVLQDQLRSNSELLGHDRIWLSMISVDAFVCAVHGVLNAVLVERMVGIVKGKGLMSQLSTTGKSTVQTTESSMLQSKVTSVSGVKMINSVS
jgi:hypothetical protein